MAAVCFTAIAGGRAFACQCVMGSRGSNAWEVAKQETEGSAAIFEGTPERFEMDWSVLRAKVGELIPLESESPNPSEWPMMVVTFRVQRAYKGDLGAEVRIRTGLGGGDCGAVYSPGLTYLVFAGRSVRDDLGVSMCSPGGWIGWSSTATELRYLKKERPIAGDLALIRRWNEKEYAAQEAERRRDFAEHEKRYAAATGEICGRVAAGKTADVAGTVSFLSTAGFSPYAHPTAYLGADGSFCSGRLGPGKYYLYFSRRSKEVLTSAVYYPGVSEKEKATVVEVKPGETQSGITFRVPVQETHSVRGMLSIYDSARVGKHSAYVGLVNLDGAPFPAGYSERIDFESSSALPKVKYFTFENVLPGRYTVYVSALGKGWYTKKEEVDVTTHMKFVSLELVHQK